jgi:hypothetical protein
MTFWDWVWVVLASVAVVVLWLAAEHLGNRWWQALPDAIREKGLIGLLINRNKRRRQGTSHTTPIKEASEPPSPLARLLCTLCAAFIAGLGTLAIVSETHSGYARLKGYVTLQGEQAVAMGTVLLCMALLPLVIWVPRRWIGWALVAWWLLLMATIFQGAFRLF